MTAVWVGQLYLKMASRLQDLTDPKRPKWCKRADIALCESRIDWIEPGKSFRFKADAPVQTGQARKGAVTQENVSARSPIRYIPSELPPNPDTVMGLIFRPPSTAVKHDKPAVVTLGEFFTQDWEPIRAANAL